VQPRPARSVPCQGGVELIRLVWASASSIALVEWAAGEPAPTGYCITNLPETTPLAELACLPKQHWRIEHDYPSSSAAWDQTIAKAVAFAGSTTT